MECLSTDTGKIVNRVAIHCFEFVEENLRRQPWRYIWELAKYLQDRGEEVIIYSASNGDEYHGEPGGIPTHYLPAYDFYPTFSREIAGQPPRVLIDVQGIHSFLNKPRMKMLTGLAVPIVGVITSPLYTPWEVLSVGAGEWLRNHRYLFRLLLGALLPIRWVVARISTINTHTVVLSEHNRRCLIAGGMPSDKVHVILPGKPDTEPPVEGHALVERFHWELLYMGSPLSLRGADIAIRTLSALRHTGRAFHLTMLCRTEHPHLHTEVKRLKRLAKRCGVERHTTFIPGVLPTDRVEAYLRQADFILQPFKIVISDMPLGILESMAMGKITISTRVDGIPEMLGAGGGVVVEPNDHEAIARCILELVNDTEKTKRLSHNAQAYVRDVHPTWEATFANFLPLLNLSESVIREVS